MYVVRNTETGEYLTVGSSWSRVWTSDIQKARTYPTRGNAKNSASAGTRRSYSRTDVPPFEALPVVLSLAE